jgi:single-stranded-DNA-specific exonuclease
MLFFHSDPIPGLIDAVYRLQVNEYNGNTTLQLVLDHWSSPQD